MHFKEGRIDQRQPRESQAGAMTRWCEATI